MAKRKTSDPILTGMEQPAAPTAIGELAALERAAKAPTPPAQEQQPEKITKAAAIREAFGELGMDAKGKEVLAFIAARYPDLPEPASAEMSNIRQKLLRDSGLVEDSPGRTRASKPPANDEVTFLDMMRVKDIAGEDMAALREQVAKVEEIAAQVGGLAKLKATLDALEKLGI